MKEWSTARLPTCWSANGSMMGRLLKCFFMTPLNFQMMFFYDMWSDMIHLVKSAILTCFVRSLVEKCWSDYRLQGTFRHIDKSVHLKILHVVHKLSLFHSACCTEYVYDFGHLCTYFRLYVFQQFPVHGGHANRFVNIVVEHRFYLLQV